MKDAQQEGIEIHFDSGYQSRQGAVVRCSQDSYEAGYVVNAARLKADHITRDFDFKVFLNPLSQLATFLMKGITPERYETWGMPGFRAQLLDTIKRKLERDSRSMQVLNAISPGFIWFLPFSEYVCQKI